MEPFNSADIRDLLPCKSLDESLHVSTRDLRVLIDRLQGRSIHVKSQVRDFLVSSQRHFDEIFSKCTVYSSRSREILDYVKPLLYMITSHSSDVEISNAIKDINELTRELSEKRELLNFISVINELRKRLWNVKEHLRAGSLKLAAVEIKDLRSVFGVSDTEVGEPIVYSLLKNEWKESFEEIQGIVRTLMEGAVQFQVDHCRLQVRYKATTDHYNRVELLDALEAMDVVGVSDCGLAKAADLIIKHVIRPTVQFDSSIVSIGELHDDTGFMIGADLQMSSSDAKINVAEGSAVYSNVAEIFKFIRKFVCFDRAPPVQSFGRLLWPRTSDLIISSFLSKAVPSDATSFLDFQRIIKEASEFELALKELLFIPSTGGGDDRLTMFSENIELQFGRRRRRETLASARTILKQCDFTVPTESGKKPSVAGSPGLTHSQKLLSSVYVVSQAGARLAMLAHDTLKDACSSSARVALELYHATRDSLILYEALVPVKLGRWGDEINQAAPLVHNDCAYLLQEILGLEFKYREDFPETVRERVHFVDLAPRFHRMARRALHQQIQLVMSNLREALDGADGFQNTQLIQHYESARFSIDQVVFILRKVCMVWEPLLPPSLCRRSLLPLLDSVFTRVARDILLLDDIAEQETLLLQKLIQHLLHCLSATWADPPLLSFRKLNKLAELLDVSLRSLTSAWEAGALHNLGFTAEEVLDFIRATFSDSSLRKDCLRVVTVTSFGV